MAAYVFLDVKSRALKQGTHQLMGIPRDRIGSAKVNGPPLSARERKISVGDGTYLWIPLNWALR